MKQSLLKKGATILLLLLIKNLSYSQEVDKSNLTFKDQFRFTLSPVLYDKLTVNNFGERLLKSKPLPSGEVTVLYYKYLKNNLGINIGAGLGLAPFYINYYFKAPDNSIFQTGLYKEDYEYLGNIRHYEYVQFMWTFPLSVQKLIKKKENKYNNFEIGIKLNRVVAYPYEIGVEEIYVIDDTTEAGLFKFKLITTHKKNIISYFFKAGIVKINKKQNTFHINVILHFSFTKLGLGEYEFYNLPYKSWGQVSQNINYIGFEFIYGLTLSKRLKIKDTD